VKLKAIQEVNFCRFQKFLLRQSALRLCYSNQKSVNL
jgi:hypothetical protein